MCGIIGYIGNKDSKDILLDSLKRLENRGYDSAGIAILDEDNRLRVQKTVGKISQLRNEVNKHLLNCEGRIGIGHTRWATHGGVTVENAHPHTDSAGKIAVVHNGIIENYKVLKKALEEKGHEFKTETDTEVLAHLIEEFHKEDDRNLQSAVVAALQLVEGTYGIAVISSDEPYKIVGARNGSPLVVGIGEKEMFLASDVQAILPYTKDVIYLDDKEVVVIKSEKYKTYTLDYQRIQKDVSKIEWDVSDIEKNGYETFMIKEISEQPEAVRNALRGRVMMEEGGVKFGGLNMSEEEIREIEKITIIACGTSWHAGLIGKYIIERYVEIPVEVDYASEFAHRNPLIRHNHIVIAISQSGETHDTLEAVREAKKRGAKKVIGITNEVGSVIARECDGGIYLHAGKEISVASTKAFTNQLVSLILFAIHVARIKKMPLYEGQKLLEELNAIPNKIDAIVARAGEIKKIALKYKDKRNFLYLGRGFNYPIALEGALKLKEISYIHAEGYPAAEMKHGPIALIDKNMPVVFIAPKDELYNKIVSNIREVKARDVKVISVINEEEEEIFKYSDDLIMVPKTIQEFTPLLNVIPLQLIAYFIAMEKGLDVDQPRNLAKTVTVP